VATLVLPSGDVSQPPQAVEAHWPEPERRTDWLGTTILYLPMIGVTILSKFAYVIGGSEILLGVPLILGAVALGLVSGRLKADPQPMAAYLLLASVLVAESVFAVNTFVMSSLILLLSVPVGYGFKLVAPVKDADVHLRRFLNFTLIVCLAGIAQYVLQFVIGKKLAYPIEHFTPPSILTKEYNTLIPLHFGATTLKSNGVVMLEPSYFSQLLALGFCLEFAGPMRWLRMALYLGGFYVSYSGTGLIMVAITIPVLMFVKRRFDLLLLGVVGMVALPLIAEPLHLTVFTKRLDEFSSTNSSGYMRYVGGIHLFEQYLWHTPRRWLFGLGAGMMFRTTPWAMFSVSGTGWVKMMLEFGVVGFVSYFGFLFYRAFRAQQPLALRLCIAVTMLLNGIFDPWSHALVLSLLAWMSPLSDVALLSPRKQPVPAARPIRVGADVVRPPEPMRPELPAGPARGRNPALGRGVR
jgi:hypothetical protein